MRRRGRQVKSTGKTVPEKGTNTRRGPKAGIGLASSRDRNLPQNREPRGRVAESEIEQADSHII